MTSRYRAAGRRVAQDSASLVFLDRFGNRFQETEGDRKEIKSPKMLLHSIFSEQAEQPLG